MKNVNINVKKFCKGIKYTLVPIALSTTMVLSGCSLFPNGENAKYKVESEKSNNSIAITNETPNETSNNNNENVISKKDSDIAMLAVGNGKLEKTNISFNNSNLKEFLSYIEKVNIKYDYEDLYHLNQSLNEYNKLKFSNNHFNKLSEISVSSLYNKVKENNKKYLESVKTSIYKEINTDELKDVLEIIVKTVNDFIRNNNNISEDRIKCLLSDLKIFNQNSALCNAFVSNDNCLILSPNMLKVAQLMNGEETDTDVLIHEINHLLQKGCNCDLELNSNLKRNFGFSYGFENIEVNSLDFSWFYEASAEKNMMNYTGHSPLVYASKISYLESLNLVNVLNENYTINCTEKLSFSRKLDDLYNYFNADTNDKKLEILKLMYSINVLQEAPDDFYELYEKSTGIKKDDSVVDDVNYTIKSSICQTMSKLFYRNMAVAITNKEVTLQDVFYMIALFENDINNHILYESQKLYNYNSSFIREYIDIQNNFFFQLSKIMGCSQENIDELFEDYCSKIKTENNTVVNNYTFAFLDSNKLNYLNQRQSELSDMATINIKEASESLEKNNQKKY